MRYFYAIILVLLSNGCDILTKDNDSAQGMSEGAITDGKLIEILFTQECTEVDKVWYEAQEGTVTYFRDIKGMKTYWDTRYTEDKSISI